MLHIREGNHVQIAFIEPPKQFWFVMGEYLPPPFGILTLASYLESHLPNLDIEVIDCQAEGLEWTGLTHRLTALQPDIVAPSTVATCNAPAAIKTARIAKQSTPHVITVVGGQHFTALAEQSLLQHPEIDIIIRGEGEETLAELVTALQLQKSLTHIRGLSFHQQDRILHTPDRPLIENLDTLPNPGYHFVAQHMKQYYFALMAEKDQSFAIVEGSRGCTYSCRYCSQWKFWKQCRRRKSVHRLASEIARIHQDYGSSFFWLTDDNLGFDQMDAFCDALMTHNLSGVTWFLQARSDDILQYQQVLPKMQQAGNIWMLIGFDTPNPQALSTFHRQGIDPLHAKEAINLLRDHDIFSQGTFIIGHRNDSHESIMQLQAYADYLNPDIATFMALTPFPGTDIYSEAHHQGWIEITDWTRYDMIHAIMPTQYLTREEVQRELINCYRGYFGSWGRRYRGLFAANPITRRTYQYLARQAIMTGLRSLLP